MTETIHVETYWLGIDAGTTAIKAGVYRPDGTLVSVGEVPGEVTLLPGGRSEQDMHGVWQGVCRAISKALEGIDPSSIASVGIAAQGDGLWSLDSDRQPTGPAILWNDTRAAGQLSQLLQSGGTGAIARACHTAIWPGSMGPLLNWMLQEDAARASRISHLLYCADWVGYCLTGYIATDLSDASIPFLDLSTRTYDEDALRASGCLSMQQCLATPRRASEQLGKISEEAAAATGLHAGTPVSVGTLDLSAMIVGMGMNQPGETLLILGTTAVVNILTAQVDTSEQPVGATAYHATDNVLTRILAPTTGAAAFDWFCALHPQTLGGNTPAEIATKLNSLAGNVAPGAAGITFLPYLNGERAPFVAANAKGAFFGLSADSTKAEMGRAVMEGTAFSLRHCLQDEGFRPERTVRLTGGGSRNALWCQIIADVLQVPIETSTDSDHGLWGAACLGASAAGSGDACELARRTEQTRRFEHDPALAPAYDQAFARYLTLSRACQEIWTH